MKSGSKKNRYPLTNKNTIYTPNSVTTIKFNYSEYLQILEVEYTGGKIYHYLNVEPEKWEEYKSWVLEGKSSGTFVNKYIKPFYDAEEVE
jgi:hypothetical protein